MVAQEPPGRNFNMYLKGLLTTSSHTASTPAKWLQQPDESSQKLRLV